MKTNNYKLFSAHTLDVLHFLLGETLSTMAAQYPNLALPKDADPTSYNNAIQVLRNEFMQLIEAMEERGIQPRPLGRTPINQQEPVMPPSEYHF